MARRILAQLLPVLLTTSAPAAVTNAVDIAALVGCANGETNGWSVSGIASYAKGPLKLNAQTSRLLSPVYDAPILCVEACVRSSSTVGRNLVFSACRNGESLAGREVVCAHTPNKDTFVLQPIVWEGREDIRQFSICLDEASPQTTVWGISSMNVITDDTTRRPPTRLLAEEIRESSVRLSWRNPAEGIVSNRIDVVRYEPIAASGELILAYDFTNCANTGSSIIGDRGDDLHAKYPEWEGSRVYYYPNSIGLLQISTGKEKGVMIHCGLDDIHDVAVRIRAKRHPTDPDQTFSVYQVIEGHTNVLGTAGFSDEFTMPVIGLGEGTAGRSLYFGNLDVAKGDRRLLVDEIAFIRGYAPARLEAVDLPGKSIPACERFTLRRLEPDMEYGVSVVSVHADGGESLPSEQLRFKTAARTAGPLRMIIR